MLRAHYPLQALLYAVALHRYLRWRQPGYDPARAPRRGAVPVRARHGRPGDAARRRGLRLAPARRPSSPSCPTCWPGAAVIPVRADGLLRDVRRGRRARRRRRPRRPAAGRGSAARTGRRCCWPPRSPCAACGPGRSASSWPPSPTACCPRRRTRRRCRWPTCRGRTTGPRCSAARWSRSAPDAPLAAAPAGRRAALPRPLLAAGAARAAASSTSGRPGRRRRSTWPGSPTLFAEPGRRPPAARRGRGRRPAGSASSPAGRAPARRTPSRGCCVLLLDQPGPPPRIALAAPTGKAAARLQESVQQQAAAHRPAGGPDGVDAAPAAGLAPRQPQPLPPRRRQPPALRRRRRRRVVDGVADADGPAARGGAPGRPAGARRRPRPADVGRGGRGAQRPGARPAPVGAGPGAAAGASTATCADLDAEERRQLRNGVVRLRVSHRFGAAASARWPRRCAPGTPTGAVALLEAGGALDAHRRRRAALREELLARGRAGWRPPAPRGTPAERCALLERHRLLCAHRHRPVRRRALERAGRAWPPAARPGEWRPGDPLLVTANDYEVGLYNGDTGVVVAGRRRAASPPSPAGRRARAAAAVPAVVGAGRARADGAPQPGQPVRRGHRCCCRRQDSPLLTRELLYTAVTRAEQRVRVVGTEEAVRAAVSAARWCGPAGCGGRWGRRRCSAGDRGGLQWAGGAAG